MMKKRLALLLACLMLFTLTACGGNEPQVSGTDDAPSSSQSGDNTDNQSGDPPVLPP